MIYASARMIRKMPGTIVCMEDYPSTAINVSLLIIVEDFTPNIKALAKKY